MLALTALALALQGKSLLSDVVPKTTGKNGYEEYLQAADLLRGSEATVYANWKPGAKPQARDPDDADDKGPTQAEIGLYAHLAQLTPLQVRREELRRFGKALMLVSQGNTKPVVDPRSKLDASTLFPELAQFKSLARFAARAAMVYTADGQTGRAVDALSDQLIFADNISRSVLLSNLVGAADTSIILSAFGEMLPRLSELDAAKIRLVVQKILARPPAARAVLPAELAMTSSALGEVFDHQYNPKDILFSDEDSKTAQDEGLIKEFENMSPAARRTLRAVVQRRIAVRFATMDQVFSRPEREWVKGLTELSDDANAVPTDIGDMFLAILTPTYSVFARASTVIRTQLRLLDLHAKLVEYRWNYGRLPESIDAVDPLNGERYVYEKGADGTVRLASKGIPETGEIELRYRRQTLGDKGEKP